MKVSREHRPMKAKNRECADRSGAFAFLSTVNASTGRSEIYGCQKLYVNLDSWLISKAKNQSMVKADAPVTAFTAVGHRGDSVRWSSWILRTPTAANMPTYTIQRSSFTRKAHSLADHCVLKIWAKISKMVSNGQSWWKKRVTNTAERRILAMRMGVRSLKRDPAAKVT